ncbi:LacI family DNA-binding transcriptional regulator [Nesterenkonia rhizosphaerae]|uniref:LacI family DNA-binding transcriptional regulator n=1 Tax=Nesterenkonia rhizosphaerae TaxID=1348272 RepID=A0ABP9FRZ4_9MICC
MARRSRLQVRPPSMVDVAKQAGVSHQTVSRVLNAPETVSPDTRRRVERVMRELGYRRNSQARALKTRSTGLIGVISQGDTDFGPARMTLAIEEAARERGYATALTVVRDASADTVEKTLDFFLSHGIDGIVVITPVPALAEAAKQLSKKTPVVIVTSGLWPADNMDVAGIDQELGARRATAHLIEAGHRSVAHIAGPMDWFDARGRVVGWRQALAVAELSAPPMVEAGGWTAESGYRAAQQIMSWGQLPDAVFAANDFLALGLIRALEERGLRVPADISVVGFDDVDAAGYFSPPLTTVRQPFEDAGRAALELLLDESHGLTQVPNFIAPELVERGSVRPAQR